jgi:sugar-specific transcriptional regulator TrmB
MRKMSLKRAMQTMKGLGLTEREAEIYLFLTKRGSLNENDLSFALNISKKKLSQSLINLEIKKMIKVSQKNITMYSAINLEKVLNESMKKSRQLAKELQAKRDEFLAIWDDMPCFKK